MVELGMMMRRWTCFRGGETEEKNVIVMCVRAPEKNRKEKKRKENTPKPHDAAAGAAVQQSRPCLTSSFSVVVFAVASAHL
jgi:hypothetical protein